MYAYKLFFGFPVDPTLEKELSKVNPHLMDQYIQKGGEFLEEIEHQEILYLGKDLGNLVELKTLEFLEPNIISILKRLVPDYNYQKASPKLFPIPEKTNEK